MADSRTGGYNAMMHRHPISAQIVQQKRIEQGTRTNDGEREQKKDDLV